jgi:hypothetical protein
MKRWSRHRLGRWDGRTGIDQFSQRPEFLSELHMMSRDIAATVGAPDTIHDEPDLPHPRRSLHLSKVLRGSAIKFTQARPIGILLEHPFGSGAPFAGKASWLAMSMSRRRNAEARFRRI